MAYSATKVITEAYYLSGVVARNMETVSGDQLNDGLSYLNSLLALKSITTRFIPYYQTYEFNTVIGQEIYFVDNLLEVEALTFNINTFRFPTTKRARKRYFGDPRADNIQSLPVNWYFNRVKGGTDIYFYFTPDTEYPIKLIGKFGLSSVNYDTDMSVTYDQFYIDYLQYQLARRVCSHNAMILPPVANEILQEYHQQLRDLMPIDLHMEKLSTLQKGSFFNYADANIGRGWRP
jgi:hypothetical protein